MHYCCKCGYILDGLTELRCPECGQPFDPQDPRTFRLTPRRVNHRALVVLMYLLPLTLALLFWAGQDSHQWQSSANGAPLQARLFIGLWQACGPFAYLLLDWRLTTPWGIGVCFTLVWLAWIILVCATRLRNLPYGVHLVMSLIWCCAGCPPAGLVIT